MFIELENAGLKFKVRHHGGRVTLKDLVVGGLGRRRPGSITVHALRDINLRIGEGERVGIIGHNGAGKSSLLRLIAGVYPPTHGRRRVEGRISSLFEITHGFDFEASGWDNIYYRGYLQGETRHSIRRKLPGIVEFCELDEFLDMPIRCLSAGMLVRLGFAIATATEPEILLVDESLTVGDRAFQHKARQRLQALMSRARLIVLVSHDLVSLEGLCDRGVWLDHGQIRQTGPIRDVIAAYAQDSARPAA